MMVKKKSLWIVDFSIEVDQGKNAKRCHGKTFVATNQPVATLASGWNQL